MAASAAFILLQKLLVPHSSISLTLTVDVLASVALSFVFGMLFKPADMDVLVAFYARVRPFGCWGPVRAEAVKRGLVPARDPMPRIDLLNGLLTALFQMALALVPFYLFLRRWPEMALWIAALIGLGIGLYFTWYRNLPSADET